MILHKINPADDMPYLKFLRKVRQRGLIGESQETIESRRNFRLRKYHDIFCTMVVAYIRQENYRAFFKLIVYYRRRCCLEPLTDEGGSAYDIVREIRQVLCRGEWLRFYPITTIKSTLKSFTITNGGIYAEEEA